MQCLIICNRHTEFYINFACVDRLIGMRVYPRCNPEKHLLCDALFFRLRLETLQLCLVIHHDAAHPVFNCETDVLIRFSVTVEGYLLRRESCP